MNNDFLIYLIIMFCMSWSYSERGIEKTIINVLIALVFTYIASLLNII